jgi:hypothetical protein
MDVSVLKNISATSSYYSNIQIRIKLLNSETVIQKVKDSLVSYQFLAGTSFGTMIDHRKLPLSKLKDPQQFTLKHRFHDHSEVVFCHLICENIVGIDLESKLLKSGNESKYFQESPKSEDYFESIEDSLFDIPADVVQVVPTKSKNPVAKNSNKEYVPCNHSCKSKETYVHFNIDVITSVVSKERLRLLRNERLN